MPQVDVRTGLDRQLLDELFHCDLGLSPGHRQNPEAGQYAVDPESRHVACQMLAETMKNEKIRREKAVG
jgi:hypothetical protein